MKNQALFTSNSVEWYTPLKLFKKLNEKYNFVLDPCTTPQNHLQTPQFFTQEQNGLLQDWKGNTFINPPYSRGIKDWIKKAYDEWKKWGGVKVLLIPARTETAYWIDYIHGKAKVIFIEKRIKFSSPSGVKNSATFPSVIVIYGEEPNTITLKQ